jgi:putative lipase involved disintegration of autophagic bodies
MSRSSSNSTGTTNDDDDTSSKSSSASKESKTSIATPSNIANTEIWLQERGLLPKVTDKMLLYDIGRESVEHFMEKYADVDAKDMAKQIKDTLRTKKRRRLTPNVSEMWQIGRR